MAQWAHSHFYPSMPIEPLQKLTEGILGLGFC